MPAEHRYRAARRPDCPLSPKRSRSRTQDEARRVVPPQGNSIEPGAIRLAGMPERDSVATSLAV